MAGWVSAQEDAVPSPPDRKQWNVFTSSNSDLPNGRVYALAVDQGGALWVGTEGGLARFAGGAWEVFTSGNSDLPDDGVNALAIGQGGALWVGTERGLARFADGAWEVFTSANSDLPGDRVDALAVDQAGALWVTTWGTGLARFAGGAWKVFTPANSDLPDSVLDLAVDENGALWVATADGLARFAGGGWEVFAPPPNSGLPDFVSHLAIGESGALWVAATWVMSEEDEVARFAGGAWEVFTSGHGDLDSVRALAVDEGGRLWAGTERGLARLADGAWELFTAANSDLPDDRVYALAADKGGALWVGTEGGLVRIAGGAWRVFTAANSDLPRNSVSALAVGDGGALWVGTEGGLARFAGGAWEVFTGANSELPDNYVNALAAGDGGALWAGILGYMERNGDFSLDDWALWQFAGGAWEEFTSSNSGLPSEYVNALAITQDGALWVGTLGSGLARFAGRAWEVFTSANSGLPNDSVSALAIGDGGALWVGTEDGVARFASGAWEVFTGANSGLPDDRVRALAIGNGGALWVGTEGGVARFAGGWEVFTAANSDLLDDWVFALAVDDGGALWVGTNGGLARFAGGTWEEYTAANSDLPDDRVYALAVGDGGALWIGTGGGLARFEWQPVQPAIERIPAPTTIRQRESSFAVRAFDPSYLSGPEHYRYEWSVEKKGLFGSELVSQPFVTRSAFYTANFPEDGSYAISAVAIDRHGRRSEPAEFRVQVETPEPEPWWMGWLRWAGGMVGGAAALYMIGLWPLLLLYSRAKWARSAVNSGAFSHAPILHKQLLSSGWARRRLFKLYADRAAGAEEFSHYIPQAVCPASGGEPLPLARVDNPLVELRARGRYLLVLGRSGTGKSVLLQRLHRLEAARFRVGATESLPVLIDAPTHLGGKGNLSGALKDALRRDGKVELPDDVLDFLIQKGGFLVLVDAVNERPGAVDVLRSFLNSDAGNSVLMASQTDVLRRQDIVVFTMVEVTPEQAASYLDAAVRPGVWDALPSGLQALTRNPQDLALIAEVAGRVGAKDLPSRRAALYAAKIEDDSALRAWVATADPRLGVLCALAFRMLAERRMLDEATLAEWIREALAACRLDTDEVDALAAAIRRSRLFREAPALDRLGRSQAVLAFDHELIGAFLAARHVRTALAGPERETMLDLAERETWQNVFFFVVDEVSAAMLPGLLLGDLLARGGDAPLRIVAYAIESKKDEDPPLPGRIQTAYAMAKLRQDVQMTPAA